MSDIIIESLRAIIVAAILLSLFSYTKKHELYEIKGWKYMRVGFFLIFLGTVVDITDNFTSLNQYIIIGDTEGEAILEKIIGYLFGFASLAYGIRLWIPKVLELHDRREKEITDASKRIKKLNGLLPICSNCKKVRDDSGYWDQIETYISLHSEAEFSHSICPCCVKNLYPDMDN